MRLLLILIILVFLVGCGDDNHSNDPAPIPSTVIDFEGIASGTELTTERFVYHYYDEFQTYVWEGSYFPANMYPDIHPSSGSDNLLTQRLEISHSLDEQFSIESIQVAERVNNVSLAPIRIIGHLTNNETIEMTFNADEIFGFETLYFDESWSSLTKVDFNVDYGLMHFDNAVVYKTDLQ